MAAVFISYSRQDQAFVHRLHDALEAQGRDAWVDWQGIAPTAEWMAEIRRAIDGADAALFVISPAWVASAVCADELAHAVQQGKRLVPVVCRDAPAGSVPEALAKLNWILLRDGDDFDDGVRRLIAGLDVDLDWVRAHTRLVVRAQEWQAAAQDDAGLLRGRDLDEAERWLAAGATHTDPAPVPLQVAFITASRAGARRRQRVTRALVLSALVVAVGLAIWAWVERNRALEAADEAKRQEVLAIRSEEVAREQEGIALAQKRVAEEQTVAARQARDAEQIQREAAEAAQRESERQRDEAVRQRNAALARQLAARAEADPASDPALLQRSALLAAESLRLLPNADADQVLRRAIARLPPRRAELRHAGIGDTDAVDVAGGFLAYADGAGIVHVVDIGQMVETFRFEAGGRVRHVHTDRAGRWVLLSSRRDGTVLVATQGGAVRRFDDCGAVGADFGGPAANLLAVGCGREVRLIDAADPAVPERRLDDSGDQLALAFDGGSEHLAGVDSRGDVRVWRVADGQRVALERRQDSSSSTSWSQCCTAFIRWGPGEHLAAHNLGDRQLQIISTRTWQTLALLESAAPINVFSFDDSGSLLATGDRRGGITVWNLEGAKVVTRMAHADEITHLELHARSLGGDRAPVLLSASSDRTARLWDPFSGTELARASQPSPVIRVTRPWAPHFGGRFVSLDSYTGLVQWDMQTLRAPLEQPPPRDRRTPPPLHCSTADDRRHWFAGPVRMLAWDAGRPDRPLEGLHHDLAGALPTAIDPACHWLALRSASELRVVDPAASNASQAGSFERPWFRDELGAGGRDGWWSSRRGSVLAALDAAGGARLWRTTDWTRLDRTVDCPVTGLLSSPSDRLLALACGTRLRVLDVASGRVTARLDLPQPAALTDDGHLVLRDAAVLRVHRLPGGQLVAQARLPEALRRATLAVDDTGRWLALAGPRSFGVWRLATLAPHARVDAAQVASPAGQRDPFRSELSFSPDGRQLAVQGFDRLLLFDTEPWGPRPEIIHPGEAGPLLWDLPRRRLLAQVQLHREDRSTDFSVRGWSIDDGAELLRIPLARAAGSLAVTGDGRFLRAEQLHRLSGDELREAACRLVARNLTRREWQAHVGSRPYQRSCPQLPEPPAGTSSWDQ